MRYAIMDLGTNTFHLLVVEGYEDRSFRVLHKAEEFVRLGEEGLDRIGVNAYRRGLEQLRRFAAVIQELQADRIIGFGTAAVRTAANGQEFIDDAIKVCPMEFHRIGGEEEAELIYLGVRQAVPLDQQPVLIMDIGGGSVEFIVANRSQILWKKSLPLGSSVLRQQFHQYEPIRANEQVRMINHLMDVFGKCCNEVRALHPSRLVGASGSFDTLAALYTENLLGRPFNSFELSTEIPMRAFYVLSERILSAPLEERLKMKGMPWFRAETMPVSVILMGYVIEMLRLHRITRSAFALKEGALWRLLNETQPQAEQAGA
ncbi:MAG: hypothetical protein RMK52_08975 [Chitinophagales bacterium]|nr:hypothetical protein [Chitinophagales bacterium]MDW8394360.1 hypothetical protein [Chitinophagales bacterium]